MKPRAPVSTGRSPTSVRRIPTAAAGVLGGASSALVEGHLVVLTCLNGGGSRRGGLRTVYRDSLECVDPVSPLPSFVRPRAPLLRPPPPLCALPFSSLQPKQPRSQVIVSAFLVACGSDRLLCVFFLTIRNKCMQNLSTCDSEIFRTSTSPGIRAGRPSFSFMSARV